MWHLYKNMKFVIKDLHEKIELEKLHRQIEKEIMESEKKEKECKLTEVEERLYEEFWTNEKLKKCIIDKDQKIASIVKELISYQAKNNKLKEEIEKQQEKILYEIKRNDGIHEKISFLVNENTQFSNIISEKNKEIKLKSIEIARLSKLVNYYSSCKYALPFKDREFLLSILELVATLIRKLLLMGNQKVRGTKLIYQIKERLAEYEDCFYRNNFKVDIDSKNLLYKIDQVLNQWSNYYEGYTLWDSKVVSLKDVQYVELLLKELSYICLYKHFEKYDQRVIKVDMLFHFMKENRKIKQNYTFHKFKKEMILMAQQRYINFEKFIINRIFLGDNYCFLKSFNKIQYDFQLMKTYGMFDFLYVYGSLENKVIKIGVTKDNLFYRYCRAKETYDYRYDMDDFSEIKIIESHNALNLESYLKRKFKQYRHPLFESTEWFLLPEFELRYFTNNEYQKDNDFMKIFNYRLDV
ncbi:hypothetical protein OJ967_25350 [Peribacillus frigoritolerans]|uniref:GIY-YIG nuclease family protein n=2 Tax=Peribacillus frigoritolerans TaxID=450367 RepID=UPI0022261C01|nr:GIY-YIG nuclease family protein [Peribacillus frigoritolerans]UYY98639.1 hypothetical protein OJ967_25350 [Peribacillus frigoritolerans]